MASKDFDNSRELRVVVVEKEAWGGRELGGHVRRAALMRA